MAKVVGPLGSEEARGAVGPHVYNSWRGVSTVRSRVTPANQGTQKRLDVRARTAICTALWQSLTDAQRDAWRAYAVAHPQIDWTGDPHPITGFNWFVRLNYKLLYLEETPLVLPPLLALLLTVQNFNVAQDGTDLLCTWTPLEEPGERQWNIEIWASGPHSTGRNPTIKDAALLTIDDLTAGAFYYGGLTAGRYTLFGRVLDDQGQVSPWSKAYADLVPE